MADEKLDPQVMLTLVNNFIKSSPPGQVAKVLEDVRTLAPDLQDHNKDWARMVSNVNSHQYLSVSLPGSEDQKVLLTPGGLLSSGNFLDPNGQQQLKIDHLKQRCTGVAPLTEIDKAKYCGAAEGTRKKVDDEMRRHAADSLPGATVTTYGLDEGGGRIQVHCYVGGCIMNLQSYWSGSWRAVWKLYMTVGKPEAELEGEITCHVHYFEDGNVQLQDSVPFKKMTINCSDVGSAVVKQVKLFEGEFISKMEDIYQTMSADVLNALRRRLPITKVKFDWDRAAVHKLASELNAFKTS